jgi:hypothetical protein
MRGMSRSAVLLISGISVFVLVLLYLTIASMPPRPPTGIEHTVAGAEAECARAVGETVPGARFPFAATPEYLGEARYRLSGTVEAVMSNETVRRLYSCVVQYSELGTYRADSVAVWQSH